MDDEDVMMDAHSLGGTSLMKVHRRRSLRQPLPAHAYIPVSTFCPPSL